jgi:hypothetical protein
MGDNGGARRRQRLRDLLLGLLRAAACPGWPGADGLTTEDVLRSYPHEARAGRVPGLEQLLAAHPDLRDELAAFFRVEGPSP